LADIMWKLKLTWEIPQGCHEEMLTLHQSTWREIEVNYRPASLAITVCSVHC